MDMFMAKEAIITKKDLFFLCVVMLVTFSLYYKVKDYDFIRLDDDVYVTENKHIQEGLSWNNLKRAFAQVEFDNYQPLTWVSLFANYQFFGMSAGSFHLINLLIHLLNVLWLLLLPLHLQLCNNHLSAFHK